MNNSNQTEKKSISEALSNPVTLSISLLLVVLILIILVGNFVICFTICATKRLRVSTFFFVASLAVADFMVGFFAVPIALVFQVAIGMNDKTIFTDGLCYGWVFANIWCSFASVLNLCSISWDRYVAITTPLRYSMRMGKKKVRRLLVFVWLSSFGLAVLSYKAFQYSDNRIHQCSAEGMNIEYAVPFFLVLFAFPVLFLMFSNARILVIARAQLKKIKSQSNLNINHWDENELRDLTARRPSTLQRKLESVRLGMEIRTFKLFLIVIGVFVFCWLPFFIYLLIASIKPIEIPGDIKMIFISLAYINSACNVFIYGFLNKDFRKAIMEAKSRLWVRARTPSMSSVSPGRGTLERELGIGNEACSSSTMTSTLSSR